MKKKLTLVVAAIALLLAAGWIWNSVANVRTVRDLKGEIARLTAERNKTKAELDAMTKRYLEESAENTAITTYLSNVPHKMDFAHPFGFTLREKINAERILPDGIYIRDGQYDDFEVGDTVVDKDTMAFAKLSGNKLDETDEKEIPSCMAALEKQIDADLAAAKYPFKVTRRVWNDNGIICFEIVDAEMYEKMSKREGSTREDSLERMKKYRGK